MYKGITYSTLIFLLLLNMPLAALGGGCDTYESAIVLTTNGFHNGMRDNVGSVSTPFVFQGQVDVSYPTHPNGFGMYADHIYLKAYYMTRNTTYLNWSVELVDWMWSNMVVDGALIDYDSITDTTIPFTDVTVFASFIGSNVELYLATGQQRFLDRATLMTTVFWNNFTSPTTRMPLASGFSSRPIAPISGGFHIDFDKWHLPPLAAVAKLTNNQTFKDNLWTYASYIGSFPIVPSNFYSQEPYPSVGLFRSLQHVTGLLYVYKILGDVRYKDMALRELNALDDAAWLVNRGSVDRYATQISLTGSLLDDHYDYMDADGINAFAIAYNVTGDIRWKNRLDAHITLLMNTYWEGYYRIYHKPILDGNNHVSAFDQYHMKFPDTLIASLEYAWRLVPSDPTYKDKLDIVIQNVDKLKGQYGYAQTWDGENQRYASPTYYEYEFFESPFVDLPSHMVGH